MADDALRGDLANSTDPLKGAALVGLFPREPGWTGTSTLHDWIFSHSRTAIEAGAVVDLQESDTAAIAANTTAIRRALASGGHIVFTQGTYLVNNELTISMDHTDVVGQGATIELVGNLRRDIFVFDNVQHCSISKMRINGRRDLRPGAGISTGRGIVSTNSRYIQILDNYIEECYEHAISVGGAYLDPSAISGPISIRGNFCENNGNPQTMRGVGIWAAMWMTKDISVVANTCLENEGGGIVLDDVSGSATQGGEPRRAVISSNLVYSTKYEAAIAGGTAVGIWIGGSTDWSITGNVVVGYRTALIIEDSQANAAVGRGVVSGNTLWGHYRSVRIDNTSLPILIASNMLGVLTQDPEGSTVYVVNDRADATNSINDLTFSGNTCYASNRGYLIGETHITPLSGIKIKGDVIKYVGNTPPATGQNGITFRYTPAFLLDGVTIEGFYDNLSLDAGCTDYVIKNNTFKNAARYNTALTGVGTYKDNIASGAVSADIRFNGSANVADTIIMGSLLRSPTPMSTGSGTISATRVNNYPN